MKFIYVFFYKKIPFNHNLFSNYFLTVFNVIIQSIHSHQFNKYLKHKNRISTDITSI